jgi:hypothetical protein
MPRAATPITGADRPPTEKDKKQAFAACVAAAGVAREEWVTGETIYPKKAPEGHPGLADRAAFVIEQRKRGQVPPTYR